MRRHISAIIVWVVGCAGLVAAWNIIPTAYRRVELPWPGRLVGLMPDGRTLVTRSEEDALRYWRIPIGEEVGPPEQGGTPWKPEESKAMPAPGDHKEVPRPGVLLPDGKTAVTAMRNQIVWFENNAAPLIRRHHVPGSERWWRKGVISASADGRYVQIRGYLRRSDFIQKLSTVWPKALGRLDSYEFIELWDGQTGERLGRFSDVEQVIYHPSSKTVVAVEDSPQAYLGVRIYRLPLRPSLVTFGAVAAAWTAAMVVLAIWFERRRPGPQNRGRADPDNTILTPIGAVGQE